MSSLVTSASSIHLRLIELAAELEARLKLIKDVPRAPEVLRLYRTSQINECEVIEAKIKALKEALADLERAR